jgi:hypothetical protein
MCLSDFLNQMHFVFKLSASSNILFYLKKKQKKKLKIRATAEMKTELCLFDKGFFFWLF